MKVLLVKPILEKHRIWHYSPPIGLGYLATAIKKDHEVRILDCKNEGIDFSDFREYIVKEKPDVVGFMFFTSEADSIKESIRIIKEIDSNIVTLVGGPHPSCMPEETLKQIPDIDYLFVSEAEIGFPLFLDIISNSHNNKEENFNNVPGLGWRKGNEILINSPKVSKDLDSLGFPSWDILGLKHYSRRAPHGVFQKQYPALPMMATRGCPFPCTYCAAGKISGKKIRKRSPENIIEEIKMLYNDYGIREITFLDDNFTFDGNYAKEISRQIINMNLNITFNNPNGVRIDTLDKELLLLMKRAGWYSLTLGMESGSQRVLDSVKKRQNLEVVRKKLNLIREVGLDMIGFFMMGFPEETEEDRKMTIDLINKGGFLFVNLANFVPLPGTEIYNDLERKSELPYMRWYDVFTAEKVIYSPKGIIPKELKDIIWKTLLKFYFKPSTFFAILIRIRLKNIMVVFTRFLSVVVKR